jgi:hypothetical protein
MLVKQKGTFIKGLVLFVSFLVVLVAMFMPLFGGLNALEASDKLFNSIAKGSTLYMPALIKKNQAFTGQAFDVNLKFKNKEIGDKAKKVLTTSGCQATGEAEQLAVKGDFGAMLGAALKDSEEMFYNRDAGLQTKYGFPGKEVMYVWSRIAKDMDKDLKKQKNFKQAAFLDEVLRKGIEVGYNFHGIVPESAGSKMGVLSFSLVFYVIYTLWWGIAILFLFEGFGLEMKAGAKKEV